MDRDRFRTRGRDGHRERDRSLEREKERDGHRTLHAGDRGLGRIPDLDEGRLDDRNRNWDRPVDRGLEKNGFSPGKERPSRDSNGRRDERRDGRGDWKRDRPSSPGPRLRRDNDDFGDRRRPRDREDNHQGDSRSGRRSEDRLDAAADRHVDGEGSPDEGVAKQGSRQPQWGARREGVWEPDIRPKFPSMDQYRGFHRGQGPAEERGYGGGGHHNSVNRMEGEKGRGPGGSGSRSNLSDALPELYSVHKASVRSVRPFGLFVEMEGFRKHALVHLSHVSDYEVTKRDDSDENKVSALRGVAVEGDSVFVKVISIKEDESGNAKIGASMKLVEQRDGADKDPSNTQLEAQQSKPPWQERAKMEFGAVLNVQCTRCGGHGHLKTECFGSKDATYSLLPDEPDELPPPPPNHGDSGRAGVVSTSGAGRGRGGGEGLGSGHGAGLSVPSPTGIAGLAGSLPVGRGRGMGMTQPAWMTHGMGVGGVAPIGDGEALVAERMSGEKDTKAGRKEGKERKVEEGIELPDRVTSKEEALRIIAKLEEEKKRKKAAKKAEKAEKKRRKREKKERKKEKKTKKEMKLRDDKEEKRERKRRRSLDDDGKEGKHTRGGAVVPSLNGQSAE
eukprot:TRINITY_DN573_c0_g2_i1.p1 TRINITY_DN573_c0_g2~~TRINITY_DN573_c0_g2_i1.p1  ORF type:complete len:642 (-),score=166.07 TRINITY_DN573_c0_g2_i1:333-2183(-)